MYHLVLQEQQIDVFHLVLQRFWRRLALLYSEIVTATLFSIFPYKKVHFLLHLILRKC